MAAHNSGLRFRQQVLYSAEDFRDSSPSLYLYKSNFKALDAMPNARKILIVDDDTDLRDALVEQLSLHEEFEASAVDTGAKGALAAKSNSPDLVLMDVGLPDTDGREVVRSLRKGGFKSPIIMLTGHDTDSDTILGLESGANDYVAKPFSPRELMLRIRNLLSVNTASKDQSHLLQVGELCIDPDGHSVTVGGEPLSLTVTEFRLLAALARQNGRVQSRESLLAEIWNGDRGVDPRTVDTHITRLREKLGKASCLVDTVYGVGYRFVKA